MSRNQCCDVVEYRHLCKVRKANKGYDSKWRCLYCGARWRERSEEPPEATRSALSDVTQSLQALGSTEQAPVMHRDLDAKTLELAKRLKAQEDKG